MIHAAINKQKMKNHNFVKKRLKTKNHNFIIIEAENGRTTTLRIQKRPFNHVAR